MNLFSLFIRATITLSVISGSAGFADSGDAGNIPLRAEDARPLGTNGLVPKIDVRNSSGENVDLLKLVQTKPTVLIFYRGGWCPFCNTHLGKLSEIQPKLHDLGFQIVAISADSPKKIAEAEKSKKFSYRLLSDSKMMASRAFGLAFKVDDETVRLYKEQYKIDLEADSGESHHLLPIPAAYVIDTSGTVRFAYHNSDYKKRVDSDALVKAAMDAIGRE